MARIADPAAADKSASGACSRPSVLASLLLVVAGFAWAGNYVVGRAIAGLVPPGGLAVGRWLVAVAVMLPFAWPHLPRDLPEILSRWRYMTLMGIAGGAVFGTLQYAGLQYTTATNGGIIGATSPVLIALAGAILFGDRLAARQQIGLGVSLAGALVIAVKGDAANLAGLRFNIGDLMILATLICWAVYSALLRTKPGVHWTSFTLFVFFVALVGNLPVALVEHFSDRPTPASWATLLAVFYTGVVSSVVGFIAWNRGVEMIGSQRAGVYLNLIPIMSVGLAFVLLGERLHDYHAVACGLIFLGLWLASRKPSR